MVNRMIKMFLAGLINCVFLLSYACTYAQTTVYGQEFLTGSGFRLNNQDTIYITKIGGGDIGITNLSGKDLLVPNNTQSEIDAFLSYMPSGVSICMRQNGGWSDFVIVYCRCSPSIISRRWRTCSDPEPSCGGSCDGLLEEHMYYNCPMISCLPGPIRE